MFTVLLLHMKMGNGRNAVSFWTSISFGNGNSRTARPAKCACHRSMKSHFVITLSHSMICGLAGALMRGCACDVLSQL